MYKILSTFLLLILSASISFSQKIEKEKSDELQFLKGQTILNLRFDYENMTVGDQPEELYLKKKIETKNSRKAGAGDIWLNKWEHNKQEDFPRMFIKLFNKYLEPNNLRVEKDTTALYTLTVKTIRIDPGFYAGLVTIPAIADLEFIFTKLDNPNKILYKLKLNGVSGAIEKRSAGARMQECYAKAGKILAKDISKNVYKK